MKTIGLIGGMSWESTVSYYQLINREVAERLGGLHSAKCLLYSVDFQEIEDCQSRGDWDRSARVLTRAAQGLQAAGADFIVICTNTMHKVADQVQQGIQIPILHIAEATADDLLKDGIARVALLGTRYTMEQDFYKDRLMKRGIDVLIPRAQARREVHRVIYEELCLGVIRPDSKEFYLSLIRELAEQGAQGVILGCTEIGLLVRQCDTVVPLYDTAAIHARRAALYAMDGGAADGPGEV